MHVAQMMFCRVIGQILLPRLIMEGEYAMGLVVQEPKVACVHGTRAFALDSAIHNTHSSGIINVDWYSGMFVAQFFKNELDDFGLLSIVKKK